MQGGRDTGLGWILVNSHTDGVKIFLWLEDGQRSREQGTNWIPRKRCTEEHLWQRVPFHRDF